MNLLRGVETAMKFMLNNVGASSRFTTLGEHSVHYYDVRGSGRGGPIVLVHGLGGSANNFSLVMLSLARRFSRVLALDFPGHGFSPLSDGCPASFAGELEILRGFLTEIVRDPAFVVGNSLGGALTLRLAVTSPERVKALGLIAPAGAGFSAERMAELLTLLDVSDDVKARDLARRLLHRPTVLPYLFASEIRRIYSSPAVRSLCAEAPSLPPLEPETLAKIQAPLLLLWGASERLLPYESITYFRSHLPPHSHIEEVQGFGHVPMLERPREVLSKLAQFADTHGL